ncbi:hypothetical protein N7468_006294 [Penicillium chermesinum]|uniref:Uncharacterized protein n=1 Tax=Penicillium chermesinum TaxID=63820 RepID=A0A9W9NUS0_9EURO|nr:uncharacterized protein N7468_006294 [Penicillium chermesinum]KAJ5225069.1 hypothetical protein N7468_006294 [Penicillium chermesinum]
MSSTENDIPMVNWEDTDSTATKNDISMGPRDDTESNTDRSFPENVELSTTCAELLRKTSPDAINFGPLTCGLGALSTKTKLAFRLEQRYSWDIETPGVAFDVWRPAFIWGVDLEQLSTNPGKFYHKDLILAKPRDSWQAAKDGESPYQYQFERSNVLAAVHVEEPPYLACRCCFQHRGNIHFANGECWEHREEDCDLHLFSPQGQENPDGPLALRTIVWHRSRYGEEKRILGDQPILMGMNTRICRIGNTDSDRALAIMNRDGIIFLDGFEKVDGVDGLETNDLRLLVIMTGLAAANWDTRFKV